MSKPPQPLSQSLSRKTRGGETVRLESRGQAREVTFGSSFERSSKGHLDKSSAGVSKSFCLGLKTPPFPRTWRQRGETRRQKLQVFRTTRLPAVSHPQKMPQVPRTPARTPSSSDFAATGHPLGVGQVLHKNKQAELSPQSCQETTGSLLEEVAASEVSAGPPSPPGKHREVTNILEEGGDP